MGVLNLRIGQNRKTPNASDSKMGWSKMPAGENMVSLSVVYNLRHFQALSFVNKDQRFYLF